jgi:hypothetical protein
MDVDRTWVHTFPCTCFRCGIAGHLARECPTASDIQHADVLDEVVCQLGDDLLEELFAWLTTTASLQDESAGETQTRRVFLPRPSERCALSCVPLIAMPSCIQIMTIHLIER